ncbi:MAG TPA: amidase [Candidatus Limnocylindrales bacterium]|nr:amidase [Candidatus Limnocylindrales bacterium]
MSAVEVVGAHIRRIEAVNPRLNAIITLDAERALESARRADIELARAGAADAGAADAGAADAGAADAIGPLHGVPLTVKDNLETAGIVTTAGVAERASAVPDRDATVVARLRAAGAIVLAKTNLPPWGGGSETVNELIGRTNNPYDLERSVSGSSGGEAAIIAAGGSPFGIGTDSGGSVRDPAHFCGLAAWKPTAGLVPVTGVIDEDGPIGPMVDPRTQIGVLARSVGDLALVGPIIAGPDGLDAGAAPVGSAFDGANSADVDGLRVAVMTDNGVVAASADTAATVRAAADALDGLAARVVDARHPDGGHELTREIWRSYDGELSSLDLYRVLSRWDAYRTAMLRWMGEWDALVCPVYPTAAHRHGALDRDGLSYTTPYSLTGWPCVVVRCGTSVEGLPIGVQVIAGPWRDGVALRVAAALERVLGGFVAPPSFASDPPRSSASDPARVDRRRVD